MSKGNIILIALAIFVIFIYQKHFSVENIEANPSEKSLIGTWRGSDESDGFITFEKDGRFIVRDHLWSKYSFGSREVTYEVIDEVEPNQVYIFIKNNKGVKKRYPFALFIIEDKEMIMKLSSKTIAKRTSEDSFIFLSDDTEMPTDMKGTLKKFKRYKANSLAIVKKENDLKVLIDQKTGESFFLDENGKRYNVDELTEDQKAALLEEGYIL